jgi:hypothetical protein
VRTVQDVGLWPLDCWNCGFESRGGHGCLWFLCIVCVLSGRRLCVGSITRLLESYRARRVWMWSWSPDNKDSLAHWGLLLHGGTRKQCVWRTSPHVTEKLFIGLAALKTASEHDTFQSEDPWNFIFESKLPDVAAWRLQEKVYILTRTWPGRNGFDWE